MGVSGIYRFYNILTLKSYIGRSVNIYRRIGEHLRHSHNPKDSNYNSHFYKALRKYDFDDWEVTCIYKTNSIEDMINKEAYYINKFDAVENEYNGTYKTDSPPIKIGEESPNAKLTNEDVYCIREKYSKIEDPENVYESYKDKVSYATFLNTWRGLHYTDVHMDVYTDENKKMHFARGNRKSIYDNGRFDNTISHVIPIREEFIKEKLSPSEVYKLHSELNRNTFNDIWYGRTFKEIAPNGYFEKLKQGRKYIRRGNNKNANRDN